MTPSLPEVDDGLTAMARTVFPGAEVRILDLGGERKRWLLIEEFGGHPWTLAHSRESAAAALKAFLDAERDRHEAG